MARDTSNMKFGEYKVFTDSRLDRVEKYQAKQTWVWWTIATAVGGFALERFLNFWAEMSAMASVGGP